MKVFEISCTQRSTGKTNSKNVRNTGDVPCVLYGNGEPVHFSVKKNEVHKALYSPDVYLVHLGLGGKTETAIVREAQFHPVHDEIMHIDFMRVSENAPVEIELPVKLTGTPEGATLGGRLQQQARKLKVKGVLSKLPERVEVDVTSLGLGKTIRVNEVSPSGYTITSPASMAIAMVDVPRAAKTAGTEAAPAGK